MTQGLGDEFRAGFHAVQSILFREVGSTIALLPQLFNDGLQRMLNLIEYAIEVRLNEESIERLLRALKEFTGETVFAVRMAQLVRFDTVLILIVFG